MGSGCSGSKPAGGGISDPAVLPRPQAAAGTFLRIVMVNDVYKLANYPPLAALIKMVRATEAIQDCKVITVLNGDFLSPCIESSLDGGKAMCEVLNHVPIDYVCFGNHEFDVGCDLLKEHTKSYKGVWLNGNISSPKFTGPDGKELPQYSMLSVGSRKICLTGATTDNTDIYRPGSNPVIEQPGKAIARVASEVQKLEGGFDLLVPLTHQTIAQDRAMAEALPKLEPALKGKVPVICGGHEHEIFIEDNAGSLIVKVGADAVNAGLIDIWWNESGKVQSSVQMRPLAGYKAAPGSACNDFVQKQQALLGSILGAEIMTIPKATSTLRVRYEPSDLASQLLLMVKKALPGVEIALLQGGAIRAKAQYQPGPFTFGGLMKELAFDTEMALIELPGNVIAESIKNTRSTPEKEAPNFLHADSDCTIESGTVTHINKEPLDPEKSYKVAIYHALLNGMNEIQPLLSYTQANLTVPEVERCLPAKGLVMETCMKAGWRRMMGGATDLRTAFADLDKDGNGLLDKAEVQKKLEKLKADRDVTNDVSTDLVDHLVKALDADKDGKISFTEFSKVVQV